jgi:hypothetical protein
MPTFRLDKLLDTLKTKRTAFGLRDCGPSSITHQIILPHPITITAVALSYSCRASTNQQPQCAKSLVSVMKFGQRTCRCGICIHLKLRPWCCTHRWERLLITVQRETLKSSESSPEGGRGALDVENCIAEYRVAVNRSTFYTRNMACFSRPFHVDNQSLHTTMKVELSRVLQVTACSPRPCSMRLDS